MSHIVLAVDPGKATGVALLSWSGNPDETPERLYSTECQPDAVANDVLIGLAGFAGVLAAPIFQVNPLMGSNLIIVVFAVVVIGGMGSIMGAILTGLGLGLIEGLTKVFYPEASGVVIFVIMAIVLLVRPAGLFGREK